MPKELPVSLTVRTAVYLRNLKLAPEWRAVLQLVRAEASRDEPLVTELVDMIAEDIRAGLLQHAQAKSREVAS